MLQIAAGIVIGGLALLFILAYPRQVLQALAVGAALVVLFFAVVIGLAEPAQEKRVAARIQAPVVQPVPAETPEVIAERLKLIDEGYFPTWGEEQFAYLMSLKTPDPSDEFSEFNFTQDPQGRIAPRYFGSQNYSD
jgi:hypothetical protein